MSVSASVSLLNHASCLIDFGSVRLLSDPWYSGTCFQAGWGLRYDNPRALEQAAAAEYLWISHFHGDHFHRDTLKALAALNPSMTVLCNEDFRFSMESAVRGCGFHNIVPIRECSPIALSDAVQVTRYPASMIDNMLLIEAPGLTILNYNDSNLPDAALKRVVAQMPPIDLVLANFNHSAHMMQFEPMNVADTKAGLQAEFVSALDLIGAKHALPFASAHWYTAPAVRGQNASLMSTAELAAVDARILDVSVSDRAEWDPVARCWSLHRGDAVETADGNFALYDDPASVPMADLERGFADWSGRFRRAFFGYTKKLAPISIYLTDHDKTIVFHFSKRLEILPGQVADAQIAMHSGHVAMWMKGPYGTDAVWLGGHFTLLKPPSAAFQKAMTLALVFEALLGPGQIIPRLVSSRTWRFFYTRREEIRALFGQDVTQVVQP